MERGLPLFAFIVGFCLVHGRFLMFQDAVEKRFGGGHPHLIAAAAGHQFHQCLERRAGGNFPSRRARRCFPGRFCRGFSRASFPRALAAIFFAGADLSFGVFMDYVKSGSST
ncbi:MAG: hypothetical protein WDO70_08715 [Alphaproteobacteria bacterium]